MIKKYERLALQKGTKGAPKAPLDQWIETIQWTTNQPLNISCISKALKYIALFEEFQPSCINLKDCYELLSDLTSSTASKTLNNETAYFLRRCLYQLSLKIKNDNTDEEETFLENFKPETLEYRKTYGKRKVNDTDSIMNPLLNNLLVPSKHLKTGNVTFEDEEGITCNKAVV